MIAAWMLYVVVVSAVLAIAAATLEHGLHSMGRPTRWIWMAALIGTLIVPAYSYLRPAPAPMTEQSSSPTTIGFASVQPEGLNRPGLFEALAGLEPANTPLLAIWLSASLAVLTLLLVSGRRIRRQASGWTPGRVEGVPVRYSACSGPAVVGCFPGIIVLPRWSRTLRDDWQAMMVAHEEEHLRAQDTGLIAFALLTVAVIPWNPCAWWMFKRLKHSIELDCDARVLRRGYDRNAYGNLLVELTQRALRGPLPAAAFAAPKPLLTRRIGLMMKPALPRYRFRALGAVAAATALIAIGCELPTPPEPEDSEALHAASVEGTLVEDVLLPGFGVWTDKVTQSEMTGEFEFSEPRRAEEIYGLLSITRRALESAGDEQQSSEPLHFGDISAKQLLEETRARATSGVIRRRLANGEGNLARTPPQVFIDGVRIERDSRDPATLEGNLYRLRELNPDDIERIEVLKSGAAASVSGPDAAGGVIRVTTKAAAAAGSGN